MGRPVSAVEYWSRPNVVDRWSLHHELLPYEEAVIAEAVQRSARSGPVEVVHVLGVGAGRELPAVRAAAPKAVIRAWDIAPGMVDAARRYVEQTGMEGIEVHCADITELAPSGPAADVVVAVNAVLCYLTARAQRERALGAAAHLLRPGGTIATVVQQRNARPDWAVFFAARAAATRLRLVPGEPGDRRNLQDGTALLVHHYARRELDVLLERAGFVDREVRSLRQWAAEHDRELPRRSTNPLLAVATRG